jgi:hypothetical protein
MAINRRLMLEYRINRLEKLLNEKTIAHGVETKAFKIWKYLRDEGPKTRPEINRQFPGATNIIPDMAEKGVIRKTGQVYEYNPTYRWDDIGIISNNVKSLQQALQNGEVEFDDMEDQSFDETPAISTSVTNRIYDALMSDDSQIVKSTIKRRASDITDKNKIMNAMLTHAANSNIACLKPLCGDMEVDLTDDEKKYDLVDVREVKKLLAKLKNLATSLTDENTGLLASAIDNCNVNTQGQCMYVVRYLNRKCGLPVSMQHFKEAVIRKCYNLAQYLYNNAVDTLDDDLLVELLMFIKDEQVPDEIIKVIMDNAITNQASTDVFALILAYALNNDDDDLFNNVKAALNFRSPRGKEAISKMKRMDANAAQKLEDKLLNNMLTKLNI